MESNTVFGTEKFTEQESFEISEILSQNLPEEEASCRPGPAGTTLTYLESWRAINLANKIFKFNGWSSSIKELSPDFIEEVPLPGGGVKFKVGVTAIVRITLKDGTFQEDVGYGVCDNPSKGTAIENAKKEAVSDARKRTLRLFGDGLGNSLYDKEQNKQMGLNIKNAKKPAAKPTAQTTQSKPAASTVSPNINNNNNNNIMKPAATISQPQFKPTVQIKPAPSISKPVAQPQQQPQQMIDDPQFEIDTNFN